MTQREKVTWRQTERGDIVTEREKGSQGDTETKGNRVTDKERHGDRAIDRER